MVGTTFERAQAAALAHYGVQAVQHEIDLDGRSVAVLVAGQGPPVVLVNGAGTPAAMLAPLMAQITGCTLYAVDWPGHGLSDPDPELPSDLRRNAVAFLTAVIQRLGLDRPVVIGSSFGAWASTWLAIDQTVRISGLVLLGCPAAALNTSAPLPMRMLSVPPIAQMVTTLQPPSPRQVRQLSKMVREHPLQPEIAELLLATELRPHFEASFVGIVRSLVRVRGARPEAVLTEGDFARVEQPTLLVFGNDDPFGDDLIGQRIASTMPDARLCVVHAGHAPWLRQSGVIGEATREFLAQLQLRS